MIRIQPGISKYHSEKHILFSYAFAYFYIYGDMNVLSAHVFILHT